jgi:hypothetical protein
MRQSIRLAAYFLIMGMAGNAFAQRADAPLQLAPSGAPRPIPNAALKVPHNWEIVTGRADPLTDKALRFAMSRPKSTPVINGKSVPVALMMSCNPAPGLSPGPVLAVAFEGLTGAGHFKTFASRYRFDEGAVHDFTATTILGKNHSRTFALPLSTRLDPGVEIAISKRLRLEVNFQTAGTTFLDFNVSGSPQALMALDCPTAAAR